jgi:hypothetical protein
MAGIEITAVHAGVDVHMLGYFFDPENAEVAAFLVAQRADRVRRVLEMLERLDSLRRRGRSRADSETGDRSGGPCAWGGRPSPDCWSRTAMCERSRTRSISTWERAGRRSWRGGASSRAR